MPLPGDVDVVLASNVAYLLAVVSFLDRAARRALATFRPASTLTEEQAIDVEYRLTTMPARPALIQLTATVRNHAGYDRDHGDCRLRGSES